MYDRKTWIILAICGALIALNLHYSGKNRAEQLRRDAIEQAKNPPAAADTDTLGNEPPAGLSVETPPPPTTEETVTLETDKAIFTLSTVGGGIKFVELKDQKNIGEESRVRINRRGGGPIWWTRRSRPRSR